MVGGFCRWRRPCATSTEGALDRRVRAPWRARASWRVICAQSSGASGGRGGRHRCYLPVYRDVLVWTSDGWDACSFFERAGGSSWCRPVVASPSRCGTGTRQGRWAARPRDRAPRPAASAARRRYSESNRKRVRGRGVMKMSPGPPAAAHPRLDLTDPTRPGRVRAAPRVPAAAGGAASGIDTCSMAGVSSLDTRDD